MILITGGFGFIGQHTAGALRDLGETCLLVCRQLRPLQPLPPSLAADDGVAGAAVDCTDIDAVLELGEQYEITGIIHLAMAVPADPDGLLDAIDTDSAAFTAVLRAALHWGVSRVCVASSLGVYDGVPGDPLREDAPVQIRTANAVHAMKKRNEIVAGLLSDRLEVVNLRLATIWGPGRDHNDPPVDAVAELVRNPATPARSPVAAGESRDWCYVKDAARAIALTQTAGRLRHDTYNVGSGRATTSADFVDAIQDALPGARIDLTDGVGTHRGALDLTRIREDTDYTPRYDLPAAMADYIATLRTKGRRVSPRRAPDNPRRPAVPDIGDP